MSAPSIPDDADPELSNAGASGHGAGGRRNPKERTADKELEVQEELNRGNWGHW